MDWNAKITHLKRPLRWFVNYRLPYCLNANVRGSGNVKSAEPVPLTNVSFVCYAPMCNIFLIVCLLNFMIICKMKLNQSFSIGKLISYQSHKPRTKHNYDLFKCVNRIFQTDITVAFDSFRQYNSIKHYVTWQPLCHEDAMMLAILKCS